MNKRSKAETNKSKHVGYYLIKLYKKDKIDTFIFSVSMVDVYFQ